VKKLKDFQKIFLRRGESRTLSFFITAETLKFYNSALKWVSESGEFRVQIGTSSAEVKEASFRLQ